MESPLLKSNCPSNISNLESAMNLSIRFTSNIFKIFPMPSKRHSGRYKKGIFSGYLGLLNSANRARFPGKVHVLQYMLKAMLSISGPVSYRLYTTLQIRFGIRSGPEALLRDLNRRTATSTSVTENSGTATGPQRRSGKMYGGGSTKHRRRDFSDRAQLHHRRG